MLKKKIFSAAALLIAVGLILAAVSSFAQVTLTRQNYLQNVGIRPDLNSAPPPGTEINASNVDQYAALVPNGIKVLVKKFGMKIYTKKYQPIVPGDSFIAATNKYLNSFKLVDTGNDPRKKGIEGYTAGLPFLKPQNGLEVAWDYIYGYNGDDADLNFTVYWINSKKGIEKSEDWRWMYIIRGMHRTDIPPIPNIPEMEARQAQYTSMTICQAPQDKRGFIALYSRFEEPKDQEGWIYIPAQRRPTRFSFGTRGDAWNNTDLLYEDVRGYMGFPEWMQWKIIAKTTYLAPMNSGIPIGKDGIQETWDFENSPHWNPKMNWEPRPMYVVEAKPKFPDYPYSKMICYIDGETFYMVFKEAYDKKGQLWKVLINAFNQSPDMRKIPPGFGASLVVDLQMEHATAFGLLSSKANVGLDSKLFSQTSFGKLGK